MLAFLPVSNVIDSFVELTDNDLPQELVSYFKTYYIAEKKEAKDLKGTQLNSYFPQNLGISINRHVTMCQG